MRQCSVWHFAVRWQKGSAMCAMSAIWVKTFAGCLLLCQWTWFFIASAFQSSARASTPLNKIHYSKEDIGHPEPNACAMPVSQKVCGVSYSDFHARTQPASQKIATAPAHNSCIFARIVSICLLACATASNFTWLLISSIRCLFFPALFASAQLSPWLKCQMLRYSMQQPAWY